MAECQSKFRGGTTGVSAECARVCQLNYSVSVKQGDNSLWAYISRLLQDYVFEQAMSIWAGSARQTDSTGQYLRTRGRGNKQRSSQIGNIDTSLLLQGVI